MTDLFEWCVLMGRSVSADGRVLGGRVVSCVSEEAADYVLKHSTCFLAVKYPTRLII